MNICFIYLCAEKWDDVDPKPDKHRQKVDALNVNTLSVCLSVLGETINKDISKHIRVQINAFLTFFFFFS